MSPLKFVKKSVHIVLILAACVLLYALYWTMSLKESKPVVSVTGSHVNKDNSLTRKATKGETETKIEKPVKEILTDLSEVHSAIAEHLNLTVEGIFVALEQDSKKIFLDQITLKNTGDTIITRGNWQICFNYLHNVYEVYTPDPPPMKVTHRGTHLYVLEPTESFPALAKGQSVQFQIHVKRMSAKLSDYYPNWYVTKENKNPVLIKSTVGESLHYVAPMNYHDDWMDKYVQVPITDEMRYNANPKEVPENLDLLPVIPRPLSLEWQPSNKLTLVQIQWSILDDDSRLAKEIHILQSVMKMKVVKNYQWKTNYIALNIGPVEGIEKLSPELKKEAYRLRINVEKKSINITGETEQGVFYGVQTLLQMLDMDNMEVPETTITDAPRYSYRGLMVDVSRNFHPKETIIETIDMMAMYKLNKLHIHLTDNNGWRIQIPGLDELTDVGSQRCHPSEGECLNPSLGSGPFPKVLPGSGFYTVEDYREILKYAKDHYIEVIPEIDGPAHSRAAVQSMLHRYKKYVHAGEVDKAKEFLLTEPESDSYCINPCMDSAYKFNEAVIQALKKMHEDIAPLTVFHQGGDEAGDIVEHLESVACSELWGNESKTSHQMSLFYNKKITKIIDKESLLPQSWEETYFKKGKGEKPVAFNETGVSNMRVNAWFSLEKGSSTRIHEFANAGYKTILSPGSHVYFDMTQEKGPYERGYYWATKFIDTKKVFHFSPENLHSHYKYCSPSNCTKLEKPENIIGMSAALWTEIVRTKEHWDHQLYPRLIAYADKAWYKDSWESETNPDTRKALLDKSWLVFATTLGQKELKRLDHLDINYAVPPPGVLIKKFGEFKFNTAYPGLHVQYSTDGGKTWTLLKQGVRISGKFKLATVSTNGRRKSQIIDVDTKKT